MDFIIQWITQIIIFVVLATIIDLLIPTTSMKKYIKLVLGLILMLIFLQPIFHLFQVDIEQTIESSLFQLEEQSFQDESLENLTEMKKVEIQASQDAYILEQLNIKLIDLAKEPLLEQHQAEITNIEFTFTDDSQKSYETLEEIIVVLHEADGGSVDTVNEVIIGEQYEEKNESELQLDTSSIAKLLKQVWEVDEKKITVIVGGGSS